MRAEGEATSELTQTVVIIGCTHAGTMVAKTLLQVARDKVKVVVVEKNDTVSFLSCGIAIGIENKLSLDKMFYSSPQQLSDMGASMLMNTVAESVDLTSKTVHVKSLNSYNKSEICYDYLVITSGSVPNVPPCFKEACNSIENVRLCKNYADAKVLKS